MNNNPCVWLAVWMPKMSMQRKDCVKIAGYKADKGSAEGVVSIKWSSEIQTDSGSVNIGHLAGWEAHR